MDTHLFYARQHVHQKIDHDFNYAIPGLYHGLPQSAVDKLPLGIPAGHTQNTFFSKGLF